MQENNGQGEMGNERAIVSLLVPGGVIFFLQLIQVDCDLITE